MDELRRLLDRQSEWQKRRAALSWPEKVQMIEAVRESVVEFRKARPALVANIPKSNETQATGKDRTV